MEGGEREEGEAKKKSPRSGTEASCAHAGGKLDGRGATPGGRSRCRACGKRCEKSQRRPLQIKHQQTEWIDRKSA